jgi:hypothetical protein
VSPTPNQFALLVAAGAVVAALCGTGLGLVVAATVRAWRHRPTRLDALRAIVKGTR